MIIISTLPFGSRVGLIPGPRRLHAENSFTENRELEAKMRQEWIREKSKQLTVRHHMISV